MDEARETLSSCKMMPNSFQVKGLQAENKSASGLGVLHYTFRILASVGTFQNAIHSLKEERYFYSKRW